MSAELLTNKITSTIRSTIGNSDHDESLPPIVQSIYSLSLTEYITTNVRLVGSYSGLTPTGLPESAPMDQYSIIGSIPTIPIPSSGLLEWMTSLSNLIKSSFYVSVGLVSHPIGVFPAFPTIDLSLITTDRLGNEYMKCVDETYEIKPGMDPQYEVTYSLIDGILDGLKSGFIPTFTAGITGTGVTTVSNILIL